MGPTDPRRPALSPQSSPAGVRAHTHASAYSQSTSCICLIVFVTGSTDLQLYERLVPESAQKDGGHSPGTAYVSLRLVCSVLSHLLWMGKVGPRGGILGRMALGLFGLECCWRAVNILYSSVVMSLIHRFCTSKHFRTHFSICPTGMSRCFAA